MNKGQIAAWERERDALLAMLEARAPGLLVRIRRLDQKIRWHRSAKQQASTLARVQKRRAARVAAGLTVAGTERQREGYA